MTLFLTQFPWQQLLKVNLIKKGIIFCPISEAIQKYPDLVKKYLGSVIPISDHYFATLNSAVFTSGSLFMFLLIRDAHDGLSTYLGINASETGQFERTLIIADRRLCKLPGRLYCSYER